MYSEFLILVCRMSYISFDPLGIKRASHRYSKQGCAYPSASRYDHEFLGKNPPHYKTSQLLIDSTYTVNSGSSD